VILQLVYFKCPMLCNLSMQGVVTSLRGVSLDPTRDFTLITVSFDPHEGPELAAAAKRTAVHRYGKPQAAARWHFLTGDEAQIKQLADAVGFRYRYDEPTAQYVHAAGLMVLTPQGRVSRYLLGVDYAPRDLQLALVEAAGGKIGSLSDQVLLLCYQYDPLAGRYGLVIQRVLRAAGIATVLALGSAVGGMLLYERRKQRRAKLTAACKE
jgi:protein SCO1/2